MKILLIGEYYSSNLGDPLLCRTVERIIREAYPEVEIVPYDISGKTSYNSNFSSDSLEFKRKMLCRINYRLPFLSKVCPFIRAFSMDVQRTSCAYELLNEILAKHPVIDLAVFAGGSLFMDYFSNMMYLVVKRLKCESIPVIFHACGMSTLSNIGIDFIQRMLLFPNVKSISLRDSFQRFTETFETRCKVLETYDTALLCKQYFSESTSKIAEYGIGVIAKHEYYDAQVQFIKRLIHSGKDWKLFVNGAKADYICAKQILHDIGIEDGIAGNYLVRLPQNAEELVEIITGFDKIISYRMHSQIIAFSYGKPCFGFSWDNKITELFYKIGHPERSAKPNDIYFEDVFSHLKNRPNENQVFQMGTHSMNLLLESIRSSFE